MRRVWGPTLHGNHLRRLGVTVDGLAIFTQATNDKWSVAIWARVLRLRRHSAIRAK
jgi:hypothetical protein